VKWTQVVDNQLVIDNGGVHPIMEMKEGIMDLQAGWHPIDVDYFDKDGDSGLLLRYQGPGISTSPSRSLCVRFPIHVCIESKEKPQCMDGEQEMKENY
jgi:hypothetical protein